ncbi:sorting nexin-16 [Denticeps clupeoides]|uniref:Sorting nexin-16 n=1 Tax=Denticeps clupeoides TaxID=299321 RepID=A0AAY4A079_9TELE|nr:sorting nexin-16 [Denticeps clupeoides]XP_028824081.1 sorting nexin-16 [Denticeps clupeoides]XP_028824082.1 sorting nexin-16 [Denticeps clupeoides]
MATPFVPVPMPIEGSVRRPKRTSSLGSVSSSSESPRGHGLMTPPLQCQSPVTRAHLTGSTPSVEFSCSLQQHSPPNNEAATDSQERPLTPTVLGYEVMEERAKFTVYKVLVKKSAEESWVVFRRYTDFARLNDKLKEMFPGFRLSLPPKRWFKDNYDSEFLEDRQLGLQAFLQNLVAHKDIANCVPVHEFLCLDDPPGPFDSLEESRAFCETLEESNYRLQRELGERQKEISSLKRKLDEQQQRISVLEQRLSGESPCVSVQGSVSSIEVEPEGDVESSVVEADQKTSELNGASVCWCRPVVCSSPPVIQVTQLEQ